MANSLASKTFTALSDLHPNMANLVGFNEANLVGFNDIVAWLFCSETLSGNIILHRHYWFICHVPI